jgi:hypothetical protein
MIKEELGHLTLSLLAGCLIAAIFGNLWVIAWAVAFGFFIDVDHFYDYFLFKHFRNLSLKEFFSSKYFDQSGKVYLPLHAFEYCLLFTATGLIFHDWWPVALATALSLFLHLIFDTITNKPVWPTYFILYRAYHGFRHDDFNFHPWDL